MALPKAIKDQVDRASQLHAQVYPSEAAELSQATPGTAPTTVVTPLVPSQPAPAAPATPELAATPGVEPAQPAPAEDWEHKFKVLQGKYNKELPEAARRAREAEERAASLEGTIANVNIAAQIEEPVAPRIEPTEGADPRSQLLEDYGEEFVRGIEAAVVQTIQPYLARLDDKFQDVGKVFKEQTDAQARGQRHATIAQLGLGVPDWEQINRDPTFVAWLDEQDLFAAQRRGQLLQAAFDRGDAERVIRIFNAFKQEYGIGQSPQPAADTPPPTNGRAPSPLLAVASPGRGTATSPQSAAPGQRTWSRKDIVQLYRDRTEGRYRGREEEFRALERDMMAAQHDGRLVN